MSYVEQEEGLVVFSAARGNTRLAMDNNFQPVARPSKAKIKEFMSGAKFFSPWGESDNLWPYTIMDALKGCAPAQVAIEILCSALYGNGVAVYKYDDKGKMVKLFDKEQQAWLRQIRVQKYVMQAAYDYFTFGNQFAQPIRNNARTGFGYIANISAPFNRVSPYDNSKGYSPHCFISGSWNKMPAETDCEKLLLLPDYYADDIIKDNKKVDKFMIRTGKYTPGNIFYDELPWHALVRNGTLDIFPEIPKIRKRRIKDAMFIKYHVRINEMYFYQLYGGFDKGKTVWEAMKPEQRKAARNKLYTEMDNKLAGSDNAFKSIYTPTTINPRDGSEIKLIQIEKIETEAGDKAAFDPDKMSNVADIFLAFNIPSAAANTVLSDNKSRGGGSDIREGGSAVITRMPMHRDNVLDPLEWCMRNTERASGAPLLAEDEFLDAENDLLTTLDNSANGVTSSNPATDAPDNNN